MGLNYDPAIEQNTMEYYKPWVTCFLTNILLSYMDETYGENQVIDCPSLFRGIEGLETPSDPQLFLKDVTNWVPLIVLRDLLFQCERTSGRKDIAHHAGRAYFEHDKKELPSLFEIIVHALNDVRSVLIYANFWGAVHTNYLKMQSFERQAAEPGMYMLAQFDEHARPTVGAIHLLRGITEGFPRMYAFIDDVQTIEEISQLRISDILREFPGFSEFSKEDRLYIRRRGSRKSIVEAIKIPLKSERISLSEEFLGDMGDSAVVPPRNGRITVLTNQEETDRSRMADAPYAYKIVKGGDLSDGTLSYSFEQDRIYEAPYSLFRFEVKESSRRPEEVSVEHVRREVSQFLFDHLAQMKQTQVRMVKYDIERSRLISENIDLRREIEREYDFAGIIGRSQPMQNLIGLVKSIAETDVTALIQGETGTGKELVARAIHYNSPRKEREFTAINCAALPETLIESELFGHEKGAFTGATAQRKGVFEIADGGTLLLDEVGDIPPSTQVKLLRVLQEGEFQRVGSRDSIHVDVRIVAATNQNLAELIEEGRFRQDLYYRLNVVPIMVPPLRERADDISLLVSHFIEKFNRRLNKQIKEMSPQALALLMAYSWPGNIRELENVIQRMMVVSQDEVLDVPGLPDKIRGGEEAPRDVAKDLKSIARESSKAVEKQAILDALAGTMGNVSKAAKALGVSRATLQRKMKALGIPSPRKK